MDDIPQDKNTVSDEKTEDIELTDLLDQELISKLDSLKTNKKLDKKYSEIYKGGIYALREKNRRENPDWMSQSANSFREILYLLQKTEDLAMEKLINDYFAKSLTPEEVNEYRSYLASLYKLFNDLTHHFSEVTDVTTQKYLVNKGLEIGINPLSKEDYFEAIKLYKQYLKLLVVTALEMHKKIDQCVADKNQDKDLVRVFFESSRDSKIYFLSLVDEGWLQWLWDNGFFAELRKPSEDKTKYTYKLPEIDYLVRMIEKDPETVGKILSYISISEQTFNPEVVDRFFWIVGSLPVPQMKLLIPKILREKWLQLMAPFNRSGYEYQKIVQKLLEAKDFETINKTAELVLSTRTKEELEGTSKFNISDKAFYLHDVSNSDIFEAVTDPSNDRKEESLKTILGGLSKVVNLGAKDEGAFSQTDPFYLSDVDIFEVELDGSKRTHPREDIQNLVATAKILIREILTPLGEVDARAFYDAHIASIPDSKTMFRLKLFAITRHPDFFMQEIKDSLFRVFGEGERYFEVDDGAEYHHALVETFSLLDGNTKREYVKNVFEYYGATLEDKSKEGWRKRDGLEIVTYIKDDLTADETARSIELFGDFPAEPIEPHANVQHGMAGIVSPKSPVDLSQYTVEEIIEHLKTDWSSAVLKEQFERDDFLNPRGAEGLSEALKADFKNRTDEYFNNMEGFFDRDAISSSYLYALLSGVDDMLRNKNSLDENQYRHLMNLFNAIRLSGESKEFEKGDERSWLADWITVHKAMADTLLNALADMKDSQFFKDNRSTIFAVVKYLLSIKSSPDVTDDKRESSEPSHVAINSVRGQAFRAFVQFTYNDEKKSLADDSKVLYEHVLDTDSSNAVRFTIGEFFASIYFRDIPFITGLLPKIFPMGDEGKKDIYFATWEGYLSSALYRELFIALDKYYAHAVSLSPDTYPDRKYSKNLDELLGGHIALAYAHFDLKPGNTLFDSFWNNPNEKRHYEFASFIGRHYLTRDRASDEWLLESKVSKQKLIDFWEWILTTTIPLEKKVFSGFGFWINPDKEIIPNAVAVEKMARTLKRSDGEIDWDYGLFRKIKAFAAIDPANAFEIIKSVLILNGELNPNYRTHYDATDRFKESLEIIYKDPLLKDQVREFIDLLIDKGSSTFWGLKSILD